jgi:malonyl CoA-acyl carrier protein transacylase
LQLLPNADLLDNAENSMLVAGPATTVNAAEAAIVEAEDRRKEKVMKDRGW